MEQEVHPKPMELAGLAVRLPVTANNRAAAAAEAQLHPAKVAMVSAM